MLNFLQIEDKCLYQGGPRFSWDNGQKGIRRRLPRLDRIYTPIQSKLNMHLANYSIHGYSVGSDHSPVHLELHIGSGEERKTALKWNVSHLKGELLVQMEDK